METRIIYKEGYGEITEKRSRFIGTLKYVETEEAALEYINGIKKANYDARHNCWAYIIGDTAETKRSSDDGEPSGTAGKPILSVLEGEGLTNVCLVVTRYFGGILLGTGGLIRAYTAAAKECVSSSVIVERVRAKDLLIKCDYGFMGKLLYTASEEGIPVYRSDYEEEVRSELLCPIGMAESFVKKINDLSGGKVQVTDLGECSYMIAEGRIIKG